MRESLTGNGQDLLPVYERLHTMQRQIDKVEGKADNQGEGLRRLERNQEASDAAIEAIKEKMNAAIRWLALGAGGLLLKFLGAKLGL